MTGRVLAHRTKSKSPILRFLFFLSHSCFSYLMPVQSMFLGCFLCYCLPQSHCRCFSEGYNLCISAQIRTISLNIEINEHSCYPCPSILVGNTDKILFTSSSNNTQHNHPPQTTTTTTTTTNCYSATWHELPRSPECLLCHMKRVCTVCLQPPVKVILALISTYLDKSRNTAVHSEQPPHTHTANRHWKILTPFTESLSIVALSSGFRWS